VRDGNARRDALDWDQGWTGRVQFLLLRQTSDSEQGENDSGFEGDGYADPERPTGEASAPVMSNVTLLSSARTVRGVRLRDGTRFALSNAILASAAGGPLEGLIDLGDALTADQLTLQNIRVKSSVLEGLWSTRAQPDSDGNSYLSEDHFTLGPGATRNTALSRDEMRELLPNAFAGEFGGWVPARGSYASEEWTVPTDSYTLHPFFEPSATYRGAFDPSGEDWTLGWTAYDSR
jgi:hypothetical protein